MLPASPRGIALDSRQTSTFLRNPLYYCSNVMAQRIRLNSIILMQAKTPKILFHSIGLMRGDGVGRGYRA